MFATLNEFLPLLSLGLGYASAELKDASNLVSEVPSYEIFTQSYIATPRSELFLRPALRLSYEPPAKLEQPQSLYINERTITAALEFGVLWNGFLVPSLTIQGALATRALSLKTSTPITSTASNPISRTEYLWQTAATIGLGLPVEQGSIIIEPFYRFIKIQDDLRQSHQWGIDVSYAIKLPNERKL